MYSMICGISVCVCVVRVRESRYLFVRSWVWILYICIRVVVCSHVDMNIFVRILVYVFDCTCL